MKIPLAPALHLLHEAPHAVLSTHATALPGFPYGTAVPLVVDAQQQPLLFISALAEHTRNLLADNRASLAVIEPGIHDVQESARMTLVGRCIPVDPEPALAERYFRYCPAARQYLALDFRFFRLVVERVRFIGGVGRMGWLAAADWQAVPALAPADEAALIAHLGQNLLPAISLLGIDALGCDLLTPAGRERLRLDTAHDAEGLTRVLPDLLHLRSSTLSSSFAQQAKSPTTP